MKYIGETSLKKLIALIKGDIATKQTKIMETGLLKGNGSGGVSAATANTGYLPAANPSMSGTLQRLPQQKGQTLLRWQQPHLSRMLYPVSVQRDLSLAPLLRQTPTCYGLIRPTEAFSSITMGLHGQP